MANVLIFGDSITYGCWDENGGWAQRLKHSIDTKAIEAGSATDNFVYPLGIPGDTTHTLLQRFKQEADARVVPQEKSVFIFAIGINDSIFNNTMNSFITPLWKYKNNVQALLHAAKRYTKHILFVGLTPVDESKVHPMPWLPECSYKNTFVKEYDQALQEVCLQGQAQFVDIYSKWQGRGYLDLLLDGVHPNTQGHILLCDTIQQHLDTFLR